MLTSIADVKKYGTYCLSRSMTARKCVAYFKRRECIYHMRIRLGEKGDEKRRLASVYDPMLRLPWDKVELRIKRLNHPGTSLI